MAPHGVYRCAADPDPRVGDDAWVAIAVYTDGEWRGLRAAMGEPAWAQEERFATLLGRKAHEDELERRLGEWTAGMTAHEAARLLRACGVPAAVVANAADLHADAQLIHRGHFLDLHHPVLGDFPFDALSYRLDGVRPQPPRAAPLLGQDNAAVYRDLLGLDDDGYRELEAEGVLR